MTWSHRESEQLYNVREWGQGYFRINESVWGLFMSNNRDSTTRIYNNLFTGKLSGSSNAAALNMESSGLHNVEVAHNTFVIETGSSRQGCIRVGGIFTRPHKLYGNIFVSTGPGPAMIVKALNPFHYEMDGNLYLASKSQSLIQVDRGSGYATLSAWQKASGKDKNSIQADPQFVNQAAPPDGLKLKPTSPAVGKAVNTPAYVTDDFPDPQGGIHCLAVRQPLQVDSRGVQALVSQQLLDEHRL